MTPQDIREKSFEKAVFGGYDMGMVDQFLEEVAGEWASQYKENAVLKSKLKVLVEKVEEYRATEDAMRMALLSAQKMSAEIVEEAKQQSETLVAEATQEAADILKNVQQEAINEEARLVEAKRSSAQFLEKMRLICTKQLDFFDALGEMKVEFDLPEPEMDEYDYEAVDEAADGYYDEYYEENAEMELEDTVRSIEDSVARMADDDVAPEIDITPDMEFDDDVTVFESDPVSEFYVTEEDGDLPELSPRPSFSFEDLRFGENYEKKD